jgi:hypothetical protein
MSAKRSRPFADRYLLDYSAEHVYYEFDMFLWLAQVCGNPLVKLQGSTVHDTQRLANTLIEGFTIHLRNVIDFLYLKEPKPSDVVADDFFESDVWLQIRPTISPKLASARGRANKEIAHLTTERLGAGSP